MATSTTSKNEKSYFIGTTIITFIIMYILNIHSTNTLDGVGFGFSIFRTFCYSYFSLLLFYVLFRFYEVFFLKIESTDFEILERFQSILKTLKIVFGIALGIQALCYLYFGYMAIVEETDANILHFIISELINLFQIGSEWIRYHIEMVIRVNNPCILNYCANEHPTVPYVLAFLSFYILRKMMRYSLTRKLILWVFKNMKEILIFSFNITQKILLFLLKSLLFVLRCFVLIISSRLAKRIGANVLKKSATVLTLGVFNNALGLVWEELKIVDNWIEKFDTHFINN